MPWDDLWGNFAAIAISILLAEIAFKQGRHWYKTGLLFCGGNLLISFAQIFANDGGMIGGWIVAPYYLFISFASYCLWIGVCSIFRAPKLVGCFRCEYVDYPRETDSGKTPFDQLEWRKFRRLNSEVTLLRKMATDDHEAGISE